MLLCFVDESGTPSKNDKGMAYFVISALIIPEAQWVDIAKEFQELKDRPEFKIQGEIKWRYFGKANDDPKNTVAHLDQATRDNFRTLLYKIITKRNSLKIVACVASVKACYATTYINNADDLYEYTYKPVTERFQYYLQDFSRSTGSPANGMIIADQRDKTQDDRLKRHHKKLLFSSSDVISKYDKFIESLFLTESHSSVGIQLCDMVAGAIGRKFNSNDDTFFEQIKPAFKTQPERPY